MKFLRTSLALALSWGLLVALAPVAHGESARQGPTTERAVLRRATLIVRDIDVSIRFYRDVLGFSVWLDNRGKVGAGESSQGVSQEWSSEINRLQ